MKNRPAGLRTYMLVSLGSCMVMLVNQYTYQIFGGGDPVRMGAQVVSGIGFLGAGTIIVTSHNQIKGLTTAAGLWASACIGLAVGIGFYEAAVIGGVAVFVVLTVLHQWDHSMRSHTQVIDVYLELEQSMSLGEFIRSARDRDFEISNIQIEQDNNQGGVLALVATVRAKQKMHQGDNAWVLRRFEGVRYLEIL